MSNNTADGMAEIGKQMEVFVQKSIAESAFRALLATGMDADDIIDWVKDVFNDIAAEPTTKAEKLAGNNTASDTSGKRAELLRRVRVLAKDINKFQATASKKDDKKSGSSLKQVNPPVGVKRKAIALSDTDDFFDSESESPSMPKPSSED